MTQPIIIDQDGTEYVPVWSHHIYRGKLENVLHHCAECMRDYEWFGLSASRAYESNHGATDDRRFCATLGVG